MFVSKIVRNWYPGIPKKTVTSFIHFVPDHCKITKGAGHFGPAPLLVKKEISPSKQHLNDEPPKLVGFSFLFILFYK